LRQKKLSGRKKKCLQRKKAAASWTAYQPISLIWDYLFWGDKAQFQLKAKMHSSDIFFRPTPPRLSPGRYTSFYLPEIELTCMKSHKRELVWTFT